MIIFKILSEKLIARVRKKDVDLNARIQIVFRRL